MGPDQPVAPGPNQAVELRREPLKINEWRTATEPRCIGTSTLGYPSRNCVPKARRSSVSEHRLWTHVFEHVVVRILRVVEWSIGFRQR